MVNDWHASDRRVLAYDHMAGELCIVLQDRVITELTVMADVHVCHDPVVVTDDRDSGVPHCAGAPVP
jgi:hypothetical protein